MIIKTQEKVVEKVTFDPTTVITNKVKSCSKLLPISLSSIGK